MRYTEKEGILPVGTLTTEYRDRFLESYPFIPEAVDLFINLDSSWENGYIESFNDKLRDEC